MTEVHLNGKILMHKYFSSNSYGGHSGMILYKIHMSDKFLFKHILNMFLAICKIIKVFQRLSAKKRKKKKKKKKHAFQDFHKNWP